MGAAVYQLGPYGTGARNSRNGILSLEAFPKDRCYSREVIFGVIWCFRDEVLRNFSPASSSEALVTMVSFGLRAFAERMMKRFSVWRSNRSYPCWLFLSKDMTGRHPRHLFSSSMPALLQIVSVRQLLPLRSAPSQRHRFCRPPGTSARRGGRTSRSVFPPSLSIQSDG